MPGMSEAEIRQMAEKKIQEERTQFFPGLQAIRTAADCAPIADWFGTAPPPADYLFRNLILRKTVGQMNGVGGVSKSSLANVQAFSGATGRHIGPFRPERPFRVLVLNVEDPSDEIWRRFHEVGRVYEPNKFELKSLRENLLVYPGRGKIGPLMELKDGNAIPTQFYAWLSESVSNTLPELCILDTKSRLCGLPENQNELQAEFIRRLESISENFGTAFQVVHHNIKSRDDLESSSSRGGQAQIDNSRFAIGVASLSEQETKQYSIADPSKYFRVSLTKGNYSPRGSVWYFERGPVGVPIPVNFQETLMQDLSRAIFAWLTTQRETFTVTDILKSKSAQDLRSELKEEYGAARDQIRMAIEWMKSKEILHEKNEGNRSESNKGGRERIILVPVVRI